ncbi:hypothetical protein IFM89_001491 [Coptis chinensis]|uniref:Subtilisin inhibitor 1 n=1 Tax=Coptis chinensis TaxID=261450 RepID=A0A835HEY6_9MAGN|nr:hypothetical protein IFM89_001491 [Coptis chinensis]
MKVNFLLTHHIYLFTLVLLIAMAEENKQTELTEEQPTGPLEHERILIPDAVRSGPKTRWPELMGTTAEEAENKIKLDMPRANIQVVPPDHYVTMDFNTRRVRLYVDASGKVARPPQVG